MTLDHWLTENGINSEEFGRRIGASGEAVRKWRSGERMPSPEMVELIAAHTGQAVQVADLHASRLAVIKSGKAA